MAVLAALSLTVPALAVAQDTVPAPVASSAADNSQLNQRDQSSDTLTPIDQSNDPADVELAAALRRSITKDDSLSMMAHNVKLYADKGVVTLRGPVETETEKMKIGQLAKATAGVSSVRNELDIKQ